MALFDLPTDQLQAYAPGPDEVGEAPDHDEFWAATLAGSRALASAPTRTRVTTGLRAVDSYDVTFSGFGGHPVRAWLTLPAATEGPLPTVVQYNGYGGGRGLAIEHLFWANAGYAHLFMDSRGQGSGWGNGGDTPDPVGHGPAAAGQMTRGILDPHEHYLRRLQTDAVLAVDAARAMPEVDGTRIVVTGRSQGGGVALAVAGLTDGLAGVMADVPFLCHFRRSVDLTDAFPYQEIVQYLSVNRLHEEQVFRTLAYFDGVTHARRATAPLLTSAALRDMVCPPSTIYAAFNAYAGTDKEIVVWPWNGHEGGGGHMAPRQLAWLANRVPA
ncbi:acetylxylan esterase [Sanguibacter massiliensis]|uniref:acetylxylan esterase n=1 Tax=Sanguibacter massiliensis TaxID=1973217 RepID=UPI000C82E1C4|nr:acetylxylan esterase [Sanguibacter massiliensis]